MSALSGEKRWKVALTSHLRFLVISRKLDMALRLNECINGVAKSVSNVDIRCHIKIDLGETYLGSRGARGRSLRRMP